MVSACLGNVSIWARYLYLYLFLYIYIYFYIYIYLGCCQGEGWSSLWKWFEGGTCMFIPLLLHGLCWCTSRPLAADYLKGQLWIDLCLVSMIVSLVGLVLKVSVCQRAWRSFRSVQLLSSVWLLATPQTAGTAGLPVHRQLPEPTQTHVHQVDAIQPSHPLSSPVPPAFNLSQHQSLSQWVILRIRWPKYRNLSISPSNEYSGLISFRMGWLNLLAVPWTLECLLQQFKSINSSVFNLFIVQLSHPYMTTGKTKALTKWTFIGKVISLLFNMLSRLVIAFLPRSKLLLILWLQSPSAAILESKEIKSVIVSIVSPSTCHAVMGPDTMILIFWMLSFKPAFSLCSFTFIKWLFSSSSLSALRVVSPAYLRFLILLLAIVIPACASSSLAFHMMYSAYRLNKQGDNIQPFPIWNQSIVPCLILIVASWPA